MSEIKEVVWDSIDENGNPINPRVATPEELAAKRAKEDSQRPSPSNPNPTPKAEPIHMQVDMIKDGDGKSLMSPVRLTDGMIHWNDPRLKTPPKLWDFKQPVEEAAKLGLLLIKVAVKLGGAGLSANQLGIDSKVFALTVIQNHHYAVFNPEILESSEETVLIEEGCLSRPGLWLRISRPKSIKVKYFTFKGEEVITEYDGYLSRVFQHEYDHMLGIDFTQRVSKMKLDMALKKVDKKIKKAMTTKQFDYEGRVRPVIIAE